MIRLGMCNELYEGWTLADTCASLKSLGYDGVEIAPFTLAPKITDVSAADRDRIKREVEASGLACIGLHWLLAKTEGFYLTHPDVEVRKRTTEYLIELARAVRDIGGELMVFGSPKQRDLLPGVSEAEALEFAEEVFRALLPALDEYAVDFCLEPLAPSETNFLNTCAQANALIAKLDHPRFRLHMDVKAQSGEVGTTVPDLIRLHGASARHFHAQDTNLQGPGMGAVDFVPILEALVASGYDRWVSVEVFDYSPGAVETASRSIDCLKRALGR
ncbi:MAG: sugar phosphate isomerase/epimerase family protein [Isosphaeraceae bacterium]|nr:sugar phosphate isomerase/epimerase family protein [Isosphaeraceae bacterium]